MDKVLIEQFIGVVQHMVGQVCWSVQVSGVGSLANLHIGDKIKRDQPMLNQDFRISMEERAYMGQYILYLEECPWRLDGPEAVAASWMDDNHPAGRIVNGLNMVKNTTIERAEVSVPGLDLSLHFSNGYVLRIFPDQVDPDEGDNYSLALSDGPTYIIAAESTLYED